MILLDTGIASRYLQENQTIIERIGKINAATNLLVSDVTLMELEKWFISYEIAKQRKSEFVKKLNKLVAVPINKNISDRALNIFKQYATDKMQVSDILIASTALELGIQLYTYNRKDFNFIKGLRLY